MAMVCRKSCGLNRGRPASFSTREKSRLRRFESLTGRPVDDGNTRSWSCQNGPAASRSSNWRLRCSPLPLSTLLLRVSGTLGGGSARDADSMHITSTDPDPDLVSDAYHLVSLAGLPDCHHIAAHWSLVRRARIVAGGKAVGWVTDDGMVQVGVDVLLGAPSAVSVELAELRALSAPSRRAARWARAWVN